MLGCGSSQTCVERRRSCAAVELPDRDAELLGLVGEVRGDARARKHDDPDRHHDQYLVVAPERCGLGMARPGARGCALAGDSVAWSDRGAAPGATARAAAWWHP